MEWLGLELHPETPAEGTLLSTKFRPEDISRMMLHLRSMGAPLGITFSDRTIVSNSRLALQAAEYARENGKFASFHEAVFHAYFSLGLDIGDREVITQLALDVGLDAEDLDRALLQGKYLPALNRAQNEAARSGVTGVPTIFIEDKKTIVGAQPLEVFRSALRSLKTS